MLYRPVVLDSEIQFSQKKFIVSKTDKEGKILFVNKNFCEVSGYTEAELLGETHSVLRHPDMPKAIFYLIWKSLLAGVEVSAIIKNLTKSGQYYWVIADFSVKRDAKGEIDSFSSLRRVAPSYVSEAIEPLYQEMLVAERKGGVEASLRCLENFLAQKEMSYEEFLEDLAQPKGVFAFLVENFKRVLN